MKIILFRHGEKERPDLALANDKTDIGLTDFGFSQINKLAQFLLKNYPSLVSSPAIYSSPYKRTTQSAEIIKSALKIKEIIFFPEFGELYAYTNFKDSREIRQNFQAMAMQNHDWVSPQTNRSFKTLILDFLDKLKEIYLKNSESIILVSTHGGLIRNTVYFLDPKIKPNDETIADSKIHEAGCTILNYDGQKFSIDQFDIHDYLEN